MRPKREFWLSPGAAKETQCLETMAITVQPQGHMGGCVWPCLGWMCSLVGHGKVKRWAFVTSLLVWRDDIPAVIKPSGLSITLGSSLLLDSYQLQNAHLTGDQPTVQPAPPVTWIRSWMDTIGQMTCRICQPRPIVSSSADLRDGLGLTFSQCC